MFWRKQRQEKSTQTADARVAASLEHLRALQFSARGFSFLPRQPVGSILTGRHGSRLRGRGLNFEELRHYRPGDDIRSMDWKVTNRTRKPHVRVYTEEREREVHLLVDQRVSMFFGSVHAMKSAVAAEVSALAAWRVLAAGDRLGGLIFNDRQCFSFAARRSSESVMALLSRLARENASLAAGQLSNEAQLNTALQQMARSISHDALVIYLGDGLGWNERSDELLKKITLHNDFIVVHIRDPAEINLPAIEDLVISDGQQQITLSGKRAQLDERFREAFNAHVERMHAVLKRYGLPLISVNTEQDALGQLLQQLGGSR